MEIAEGTAPSPPSSPNGTELPRVIHHTWRHEHLHPLLRRCVDSFRKWNPDWTLRFWTDEDCERFIAEELPDFLPTYLGYPRGILRADLFRVAVLYVHGGVYADLDMECLRPLDVLVRAATGGEEDWEVLLARDHPVHERGLWEGGPMWMNAFLIAKPRALYLGLVLGEFARQLRDGIVDEADPVMTTGPGLFTDIVERQSGGLTALGIREMSWRWVHPLPNVQNRFDRNAEYESLIRHRLWRDGVQPVGIESREGLFAGYEEGEPPYVAHYWWHSYIERCQLVNMLTRHGACLLQSDGEIVERRLGEFTSDACPQSLGEALCQLAERAGTRIRVTGERPSEALSQVLRVAGEGFDWSVEAEEVAKGRDANAAGYDLHIEMGASTKGEGATDSTAARGLREKGLFLRLEDGRDAGLNGASDPIGLRPLSERFPLFEKRPEEEREAPNCFHWLEPPSGSPLSEAAARSWQRCHPDSEWRWRHWGLEEVEGLIAEKEPALLPTFHDYPTDEHRRLAARWVILKHEGGVVVPPDAVCLQPVAALLQGKAVHFSARSLPNGGHEVTDQWLSSPPRHPFWNGLVAHLEANRFLPVDEAVGAGFLDQRCQAGARLLDRQFWPTLEGGEIFGVTPVGSDWLRLVRCENWTALAQLAPGAVTLSMRECWEAVPDPEHSEAMPELSPNGHG